MYMADEWLILYKLCYFEKLAWDKDWIKTAEEIIKDEFRHSHSNYVINKPLAPSHLSRKVIILLLMAYYYTNLTK